MSDSQNSNERTPHVDKTTPISPIRNGANDSQSQIEIQRQKQKLRAKFKRRKRLSRILKYLPLWAFILSFIGTVASIWVISANLSTFTEAREDRRRKDLPQKTKADIKAASILLFQQDKENPITNHKQIQGFVLLIRQLFKAAQVGFPETKGNWARRIEPGQRVGDLNSYGNDLDQLGPYIVVSGADKGNANDEPEDLIETYVATRSIHIYVSLGWASHIKNAFKTVEIEPKDNNGLPLAGNFNRMVRLEIQIFHPDLLSRHWRDLIDNPLLSFKDKSSFQQKMEAIGIIAFPIQWRCLYPEEGRKDYRLAYSMRDGIPKDAFDNARKINRFIWGNQFKLQLADERKTIMGPYVPTESDDRRAEQKRVR